MHFANWLKNARTNRKLEAADLAKAMGISLSTYRQIEGGSIKRPPQKRLDKLATALEVSPDTIARAFRAGDASHGKKD
jgi:transcriptional regulator with XRE-family HTH domain